mgnify:CR=1 FL=1
MKKYSDKFLNQSNKDPSTDCESYLPLQLETPLSHFFKLRRFGLVASNHDI